MRSHRQQVHDFYAHGVPTDAQRASGHSIIKAAGAGGVLFDFGGVTGNPIADNWNVQLARHADPTQAQVAHDQRAAFERSLVDVVKGGDGSLHEGFIGMNHQGREPGSLDEQVVALVKAEGLSGEKAGQVVKPGQAVPFKKSEMVLNGETIVGQSETDAAVIEMMKSMQDSGDDGEFVIDATEG